MSESKFTFKNDKNIEIVGILALPEGRKASNYAIFAHCFTCNKNLLAIKNISQALNEQGIGVLRFDFTGLGESAGEFKDSGFLSNIQDLVAASNFLQKEKNSAPTIIIGHSLGGAAAVYAAKEIPSIKAVVTIGAPSAPQHVQHLMSDKITDIIEEGQAEVNIGGRPFTIKKNFLNELDRCEMPKTLQDLRKPILIIHSPQDTIVGIENAQEIYINAHHPKSFISIDGADHLLSRKTDSSYVGEVIAGWVKRYIETSEEDEIVSPNVRVNLAGEKFKSHVNVGKHYLIADEPKSVGGTDLGPNPYEFVSAGLGACTAMTLKMYANRKKWPLVAVQVEVDHGKEHCEDCYEIENPKTKIDTFRRTISIIGGLSEEQKNRLLEIADKCPVHKTLEASSKVITEFKK